MSGGRITTPFIYNSNVTYEKIQNVSATNLFLGRKTAGAGVVEEINVAEAKTILDIGTNYFYNDYFEYAVDGKDVFSHVGPNGKPSNENSPITLADGEIVHVTISTKDLPTNNFFVQAVKNAFKGGAGTLSGGTQIGTDLDKTTGDLNKQYNNLTGFTFAKGDKISAYVLAGTFGTGTATDAIIRFYIKYTGAL